MARLVFGPPRVVHADNKIGAFDGEALVPSVVPWEACFASVTLGARAGLVEQWIAAFALEPLTLYASLTLEDAVTACVAGFKTRRVTLRRTIAELSPLAAGRSVLEVRAYAAERGAGGVYTAPRTTVFPARCYLLRRASE